MNRWKHIFCLVGGIIFLSSHLHRVAADEIYYCYDEVIIDFDATSAPDEVKKILGNISEFTDGYSVGLNLTKKQIDYNDVHARGEDWVDAAEVKVEGNKWIMTSPIVYNVESPPEIIIVYFNKENLQYTELYIALQDYSEPGFSNPDPKGRKRYVIISGRCKMNLS